VVGGEEGFGSRGVGLFELSSFSFSFSKHRRFCWASIRFFCSGKNSLVTVFSE
jgi:hypothetical protein